MQKKSSSLLITIFFLILFSQYCFAQSADVLIKTGRDYSNLFQYDKAIESFKKAVEIDPENWEANYYAGITSIKLKKLDDAERFLSKALRLNPTETDIQKALGAIYINQAKVAQTNGQTAKKIELQLKACHAYPAATKVWLSVFEYWWDNNEYNKIKNEGDYLYKNNQQLIDQAEDKSLQQALVMVAKAYYNDGDYNKSETFLNYASKIRAQNEELYGLKRQIKNQAEEKVKKILEQAENEINAKDYKKAIETLKLASKAAISNQSEIENKIENLEKQIEIDKYLSEINALIDKKDYEKAYTKLDEALQNFPENEELLAKNEIVVKAIEEIEEEKDKAEQQKRRAIEAKRMKEEKINDLKAKAKKLEKEQNYDEAIEKLTQVSKLLPSDTSITSKIEELKISKKKAIERQNNFIKGQSRMQDYFDSKDYENCAENGESLLREFPEHKETISSLLAECYLKLDKYEEAAKAVEPLEKNEQYTDLYNYAKGLYAYKSKNEEEAKTYLELVKQGSSKYKRDASRTLTIMFLTSWKAITGISFALLTVIILILPKIKEYFHHSNQVKMANKLERIKESGNYEANFNFLKQRFEKEDVDNMKLVMLLYAAALQKKGDFEQSYKLITDYLKRDARSPLARNIAGETAMSLGLTTPQALEQIQGLLKLNENRKDVVEYLAKAYIGMKADHKLGQEFIAKYVSLNPNDTEALTYLADVYFSRQTYNQQTIKTFEKAIKACPDKPEYYVALMENNKALGNQEEATKLQEQISQMFPDYYGGQASAQQPSYDNFDYNQQPNYDFNQQISNQQQMYAQQNYNQNSAMPSNDVPSNQYAQANNQNFDQAIQQQQMLYQQQASPRNTGAYPDYDSIGSDSLPTLDALNSNLGNNSDGMANFNDLIQPNKDIVSQEPQNNNNAAANFVGPKKNCPHCGAVNPASEYYCNSCGKPF